MYGEHEAAALVEDVGVAGVDGEGLVHGGKGKVEVGLGDGEEDVGEDFESADELRMQIRNYISKYEDAWLNIFTTDDPQFQDT